jgi:hypothetical protein
LRDRLGFMAAFIFFRLGALPLQIFPASICLQTAAASKTAAPSVVATHTRSGR